MWDWIPAVWVTFVLLLAGFSIYALVIGSEVRKEQNATRCQAAQQTILDEAELIAAGGKFPGEQVTDRWRKLLGGC